MDNKILIFVSGVVVGAVCGHVVTKYVLPKFKKSEVEEEIPEEVEAEEEQEDEAPEPEQFLEVPKEEEMRVKHDVFDYSGLTRKFGYSNKTADETEGIRYAPYLISQAEFDDERYRDYESIVLTYYADGILARDDDNDAVIMNPDQVVGAHTLGQFLDNEVDVIYVRDDSSCVQYEIDRDNKKYEEVVGRLDEEDDA